ncbi:MAG: GTPase Era [Ruminococcaceae bacterium]|nr:GTPase Era [Oscillospiraceae bacterium]
MEELSFKSGFVALTGLANAGKSTLLNQFSGMHLAITSPKPQTTRQVIRAIIDDPGSQIIFLDTPGYHAPRNRLDQYMYRGITSALTDADILLLVTDASAAIRARSSSGLPRLEQELLKQLARQNKPVILVLNKVDIAVKEELLPIIARYHEQYPFAAIVPVSARTGDGIEVLLHEIRKHLAAGPRYYPVETLTDQTERQIVAELVREQVLLLTHEEIPHGVAVEIESFTETGSPDRKMVHIDAAIYCEKDSHKGILIGKQGSMLKNIGSRARQQIEELLGCPCYLELFVKVRDGWRNRQEILRSLGLDTRS